MPIGRSGLPGSWRVLPCLCPAHRPRSRLTAMPLRQLGVAPAVLTTKAATITISRLLHTASALAVYASSFGFPYAGKTRFRRVATPYRVGFVPTGLQWRISSRPRLPIYPNAPGFARRHSPQSFSFLLKRNARFFICPQSSACRGVVPRSAGRRRILVTQSFFFPFRAIRKKFISFCIFI
jgi:hypothetical protein